MIEKYVQHFEFGSVDDHKASQELWIQDVGPAVETNIGFIESYRDPLGVRAEYEGLVSMVDRETSKKFGRLVDSAEHLISCLPWSSDFEKDVFQKPDFTSLDVLAFASSGIPLGMDHTIIRSV